MTRFPSPLAPFSVAPPLFPTPPSTPDAPLRAASLRGRRIPTVSDLAALLLGAALLGGCEVGDPPDPPPLVPVEGVPEEAEATPDQVPEAAPFDLPAEQEAFWTSLEALCGMAFEGTDAEVRRVMHVRQCFLGEIRIPLHVDEDRSRTWIVTRQPHGLRLKHDHRHPDGTDEEITQYGGDTREAGSATTQEFHADVFTAELVPGAGNNIWTMEIHPGELFAYQLVRTGEDWVVRWEFDLTAPVDPPPAPWGYEDTEPTHGG